MSYLQVIAIWGFGAMALVLGYDVLANTSEGRVESVRVESGSSEPLDVRYRLSVSNFAAAGDLLWARLASEFQYTLNGMPLPQEGLASFSLRAERGLDGDYWLILNSDSPVEQLPITLLAQLRIGEQTQLLSLEVPEILDRAQTAGFGGFAEHFPQESQGGIWWFTAVLSLLGGLIGLAALQFKRRQTAGQSYVHFSDQRTRKRLDGGLADDVVSGSSAASPEREIEPESPRISAVPQSAEMAEVTESDNAQQETSILKLEEFDSSTTSSSSSEETKVPSNEAESLELSLDGGELEEVFSAVETALADEVPVALEELTEAPDVSDALLNDLQADAAAKGEIEQHSEEQCVLERGDLDATPAGAKRDWLDLEQFLDLDELADVYGHQDDYGADLRMMEAEAEHQLAREQDKDSQSDELEQWRALLNESGGYDQMMDRAFGSSQEVDSTALDERGTHPFGNEDGDLPPLDQAVQIKLAKAAIILARSGAEDLSEWLLGQLAKQSEPAGGGSASLNDQTN